MSQFLDLNKLQSIVDPDPIDLFKTVNAHQNLSKVQINSIFLDAFTTPWLLVHLEQLKHLKELHLHLQCYDSFEKSHLAIEKLKIRASGTFDDNDSDPIATILSSAPFVTHFSLSGGHLSTESILELNKRNLCKMSLKNVTIDEDRIEALLPTILNNNQLTNLKLILMEWEPQLNSLQLFINLFLNRLPQYQLNVEKFAFSLGKEIGLLDEINLTNLINLLHLKKLKIYFTVQFEPYLVNELLVVVPKLRKSIEIDLVEFFAPAPRCYRYSDDDFHKYSQLSETIKKNAFNLVVSKRIVLHSFDYE